MRLVESLVAGIAGAASGTATFVLRGTASSAASVLYNDFEGTTQPGTNIITLDSNGCAEVYVNAYCDMTLKTQAGATLRTVTVGDSATTVECISDSFTGIDYSGSPTAVSEPITLAAILDKWNNSAGSVDWKVSIGGVSTNLSSAFASLTGIYVNVKDPTYGAIGDGVTDDTTAISNAITAAAGGIVFFPPGTYKISTLTITSRNYNLLGSGPGSSIITGYQANTSLILLDNSIEGFGTICQLGFAATAAYTNCIAVTPTQNIQITNCHIDTTNFNTGISNLAFNGDSFILVNGSIFTVDVGSGSAISNLSNDDQCSICVTGCLFEVDALFTGSIILGPDFNVTNCIFDASSVTSGVYYHINAKSNQTVGKFFGVFVGNKFVDGGSSGFAFNLQGLNDGSVFKESDNDFSGFVSPSLATSRGQIYANTGNSASLLNCDVVLGSRAGNTLRFSTANASITTEAAQMAEHLIITFTFAGNFTVNFTSGDSPPGTKYLVTVVNSTAATRDIVFSMSGISHTQSAVAVNGTATCLAFQMVESTGIEVIKAISTIKTA